MEKIDFKKTLKDLYAPRKKIQELEVGDGQFLSVEGKGLPGGPEFQSAVGKLYGTAYTMKFGMLHAEKLNFAVCSLEALYFDDPSEVPMENWRWDLLIRVPDEGKNVHRHARAPEVRHAESHNHIGHNYIAPESGMLRAIGTPQAASQPMPSSTDSSCYLHSLIH